MPHMRRTLRLPSANVCDARSPLDTVKKPEASTDGRSRGGNHCPELQAVVIHDGGEVADVATAGPAVDRHPKDGHACLGRKRRLRFADPRWCNAAATAVA